MEVAQNYGERATDEIAVWNEDQRKYRDCDKRNGLEMEQK